ncbi:MAG: type II secretion system F family protein [Candidatus ainarchaeum sp.]|nr:type II secretion system F family protein [Candidatus ainarchaeum sp.]
MVDDIMIKKTLFEKYEYWMEFSKMKINAKIWILLAIFSSLIIGVVSYFVLDYLLNEFTLLPFALSISLFFFIIGLPYFKAMNIINSCEENFSMALKQMADVLRAGDTYESSLREVANSDYGRLSEEFNNSLRMLEDGENLENSLSILSERIDSKLIRRTMVIVLEAIKAGGSLADILEEISEDIRDLRKIENSRRANTTMQFAFMLVAGAVISPAIFGEITGVMELFSKVALSMSDVSQAEVIAMQNFMYLVSQAYLIIQVIATGLLMAIIRYGKFNKSILYVPALILVSFIFYYGVLFVARFMFVIK